jgi:hypothetical protein
MSKMGSNMKPSRWFVVLVGFCFVILSRNSLAQEDKRNYLGLSFGGSDFHLKDDHASPLIFSSVGIAPTFQFFHLGDKSRHSLEGSYYYAYLSSSSDNFNTDNWRGRVRYSYVHLISNFEVWNRSFGIFLGGSINSFYNKSNYYYALNTSNGISIVSWYWSHSLDLTAQVEYNIAQRESFSMMLYVPVISNVSRPKYSPSGDYNYDENTWKVKAFGETEIFPRNLSVNVLLNYQRVIVGNFDLRLSYEFYYSSYDKPTDMAMYMNNLRAGLFFCF